MAYLDRRYRKEIRTMKEIAGRVGEWFDDDTYERGLAELFGYKLEDAGPFVAPAAARRHRGRRSAPPPVFRQRRV